MWNYISGVLKVVEEKKKENNPKAARDSKVFKRVREEQDKDVFGGMACWPAVATA